MGLTDGERALHSGVVRLRRCKIFSLSFFLNLDNHSPFTSTDSSADSVSVFGDRLTPATRSVALPEGI